MRFFLSMAILAMMTVSGTVQAQPNQQQRNGEGWAIAGAILQGLSQQQQGWGQPQTQQQGWGQPQTQQQGWGQPQTQQQGWGQPQTQQQGWGQPVPPVGTLTIESGSATASKTYANTFSGYYGRSGTPLTNGRLNQPLPRPYRYVINGRRYAMTRAEAIKTGYLKEKETLPHNLPSAQEPVLVPIPYKLDGNSLNAGVQELNKAGGSISREFKRVTPKIRVPKFKW